ncbi:hypothetical protein [Planctomicrobium sp. SH527]|uniref:hypothetical protein n=1 Tax=Planctomicrobium sp. SH527 TaxID=3448123 RepID=UPI003F5ADF2F
MLTRIHLMLIAGWMSLQVQPVLALDEFEQAPINYSESTPVNPVTALQEKLVNESVKLEYDEEKGYLKSLLAALEIPVESQVLVYSKTSLQISKIHPRTPRAIYFNDDIAVGYAQNGDLLELSVSDPKLGMVFYTLDQENFELPRFVRQTDRCLTCHSSSRTENVPGHLVRSLFVDARGLPIFSSGSKNVDHRTPIEQRWGGWYVTGTHGSQIHQGNFVSRERTLREPVENAKGQNLTSLEGRFKLEKYLTPHSDIVALMVLEHQVLVQNRITQANYTTQQALHYQMVMRRDLDTDSETVLQSVERRINNAGEALVDALLMVEEAPIIEKIEGTAGYEEVFQKAGPRDSKGRSLRDLDMTRRMFRYPCSYLIYSPSFDGLPDEVKSYVWDRLKEVLTGQDTDSKFAHLSPEDRRNILEILVETKPDAPASFKDALAAMP